MTRGLLARIVATFTVPLVVVATCVLSQSPASSATCDSGSGVSVVVDPGALGGSIATVCDPGSGEVAATRFEQSGFALTEVQRFPGFVCRVNGAPASDPCVNTPPADAYWSLWWTDGTSGTWAYASQAVTSLEVPDGGAVALVWQQGPARRTPGVAAPVGAAPSPTPTKTPTPTATTKPTRTPTATPTPSATSSAPATSPTGSSSPTAEPSESTASSSPSTSPSSSPTDSPSASATAERSEASPTERPADPSTEASAATPGDTTDPDESRATGEQSSTVPTWLTVTILGLLLIAIGMSTYAARRRTHH